MVLRCSQVRVQLQMIMVLDRGRSGFEVYTGKGTVANDNGVGVGGQVVLRCTQVRVQLHMIMVLE